MRTTPARCWLAIALALLAGAPAAAKSFHIARQSIGATVRAGGSMHVHNTLTFDFSGSFHHAFLEVRLPGRMHLTGLIVLEGTRQATRCLASRPGQDRLAPM